MGKTININLTKFKSEKLKIISSATDVTEAEKSVTFASYTNLSSSSQMESGYKDQEKQSKNYISQVKSDMENLQAIVTNLKKVDEYSAMKLKVKH